MALPSTTAAIGSISSQVHAAVLGLGSEDQISLYQWSASVHRPQPVTAPIHLFVSGELAALNRDPTLGWQRYSRQVTLHPLPGLHLESITRHLPRLVEQLLPIVTAEPPARLVGASIP
jgi:hypothetical protein